MFHNSYLEIIHEQCLIWFDFLLHACFVQEFQIRYKFQVSEWLMLVRNEAVPLTCLNGV